MTRATSLLPGLLLGDAAVESFLAGSPLRLWIAGAVVLYFALTLATWRFMRSRGKSLDPARFATSSLLLLLGLVAATVWFPAGATDGIVMFRQPTGTVLSILTAVAVLVAGGVLVRLAWLPVSMRTIGGVLAAYGASAFVLGIVKGAPYTAMFQGASFWQRLPVWGQGA